MAKDRKPVSPTLSLSITEETRQRAIESNSGGCLIADAMKDQYPHLSGITVDMATIRATDRAKGYRYIYLTPPEAQHVLLSFDQGWPNPISELTIRRAVQILPVTSSGKNSPKREAQREAMAEKIAALEAKESAGEELTTSERKSLATARHQRSKTPAERPTATGPAEVVVRDGGENHGVVIHGGAPIPQGPAHPNLLRGRNRHFGAKMADPGKAFNEAVEAALVEREKQREQSA